MKTYILFCLLFLFVKSLPAQTWTWDSLIVSDFPISLVKDHMNNVYTFTRNKPGLVKYNSSGDLIWQKTFPALIRSVICGRDNMVYVTGRFGWPMTIDSETLISAGLNDIFIVKFDENGTLVWLNQISSEGNEEAGDLCLDKTNKLLVTGSCYDTTNFSGTIIPKVPNRDLFLARYDLAGNFEAAFFASFMGTTGSETGSAGIEIEVDTNNDIILLAGVHGNVQIDTTVFSDSYSAYFIKLDSAFRIQWNKKSETNYMTYVNNVMINSSNEIIYTVNRIWHYANYGKLNMLSADGTTITNYLNEDQGQIYGIDLDYLDNIYFASHGSIIQSMSGAVPNISSLHYGKMNSVGVTEWLIVDSAQSGRTGYDIAVWNDHFFVAGAFRDSISLLHDYIDPGVQHAFLAVMNMGPLTNIASPSDHLSIPDYTIFPNPTSNQFTLQLNEDLQKQVQQGDMIFVFDQLGNCILRQQFFNSPSQQVDISKMAKGIYFIEVETGKDRINKKIVLN